MEKSTLLNSFDEQVMIFHFTVNILLYLC
jgi:hypothetical protein